jgi:hypothetical protein
VDKARRSAANVAKLPELLLCWPEATPAGNIIWVLNNGVFAMNHITAELDQTEEDILNEVSDETLEAAAGTYIGGQFMVTIGPTIMVGGCCWLGSQATARLLRTSQPRRSDRPAKTARQTRKNRSYGEVWPGARALTHAAGHTGPRRGEEDITARLRAVRERMGLGEAVTPIGASRR